MYLKKVRRKKDSDGPLSLNLALHVLYCTVLYCIVLYCIVLYCVVLHYIVLCCNLVQ